jgi:large subunit ribosomal protein L17
MRHGNGYRKLNRTHEHRKAMFANMVCSLIEHEQITTTLPKAKELKRIIDRVITLGKKGDLHARRIVSSRIKQEEAVKKLFSILGPRYEKRNGGYCRVIRAGYRYGDMAPMAIIEMVERDVSAKGAGDKARVQTQEEVEAA